jgi:hypothetical protein
MMIAINTVITMLRRSFRLKMGRLMHGSLQTQVRHRDGAQRGAAAAGCSRTPTSLSRAERK